MIMKQNDNSLLFTFLICLIFITVLAIVVQFDLIQAVSRLFNSEENAQSLLENKKQLVTYYQWQDNGNMVIARTPPKDGKAYITFQGDINLTQSHYDIDPELIARAEAFRQALNRPVVAEHSQSEQFITSLLTPEQQRLLRTEGACHELDNWLNNMSLAFNHYDEDTRRQFCQQFDQRLGNLVNIGCQAEIHKFQKAICL